MTIKTFDSNRVGGGTFQLEQDPLTGEYKVKEVGFIKLPDLKLPELEQAAPVVPDPTPDDPTDDDPADPGTGGAGGGGAGERGGFTGESMLKNIQKEATGDSANLINQATTLSSNLNKVDRTSLDQGAIKVEDIRSLESMPKSYQNLVNEYNRHQADVQQRNMTGSADEEQALSDLMYSRELRNQINEMKGTSFVTKEGATITAGRKDPEIIKAAPKIADFSEGPKTVPFGTLTGGTTPIAQGTFTKESIDKSFLGEEGTTTKKNILKVAEEKVKKLFDPEKSMTLQIIGGTAKAIGGILSGGREPTATQKLNTSLFQTRGDLGSSVDPGRIVGDPTTDLYAGMNRNSLYGNLEAAGNKRIERRTNTVNKRGVKDKAYAEANGLKYDPKGVSAQFHRNTNGMKKQAATYKREKEATIDTSPGATGGEGGGSDKGSDSGKIVCTMMNESYGFGSFRNKIWMKFHGDIAPEYQKGYHKLFLPLVSYAKQKGITNKIIKNILEHIAVHSTIDMRQTLRGKTHLLGRIYRKIILPLCYWAGRK